VNVVLRSSRRIDLCPLRYRFGISISATGSHNPKLPVKRDTPFVLGKLARTILNAGLTAYPRSKRIIVCTHTPRITIRGIDALVYQVGEHEKRINPVLIEPSSTIATA
jgi:hypothetical protein